jgi:hypothetical protein
MTNVFRHIGKNHLRGLLLQLLGLRKNVCHVATEDRSWDPQAFERFQKYLWLRLLTDICIASHWQKSFMRCGVAAVRVMAKFISCGYREHFTRPACIRTFFENSTV